MIDTPRWPLSSDADDKPEFVERRKTPPSIYRNFFDDDSWEFPPLIYPRPLVDKALLDRDDVEISDDDRRTCI